MPQKEALRAHLLALRHDLLLIEQELQLHGQESDEIDIVQLKPSADPAFGGLLMRVKKRTPFELRGYLLLPRRGGGVDTWTRVKPGEVTPVGKLIWPEAKHGFRPHDHCNPLLLAEVDASIRAWAMRPNGTIQRKPSQSEASLDDDRRIDRSGDRGRTA